MSPLRQLAIATEPDTIEQGLDEDYIANVSTTQTAAWNPLFTQD